MSVELDPVELGFRRPFTHEVSETLRLKNPHSDPVAFKVKTTAPKHYCVRPNSGRIEAGQYVEVQVLLQAMKEDPPLETKCRDKFLVQSVGVPANQEFASAASVWSAIEQTSKSSIQEKKIRVTFLPANGFNASTPVRQTNAATTNGDQPPAYDSPVTNAVTPNHQSNAPIVGSVSTPESRPEGSRNLGDAVDSANNPGASRTMTGAVAGAAGVAAGAIGTAASGVARSVPTSSDDVKAQLEEAKATIARMTKQIQDQGLRQRKTETVDSKGRSATSQTALSSQQMKPSGVPVQIVAALCLLSFLLAYLFF